MIRQWQSRGLGLMAMLAATAMCLASPGFSGSLPTVPDASPGTIHVDPSDLVTSAHPAASAEERASTLAPQTATTSSAESTQAGSNTLAHMDASDASVPNASHLANLIIDPPDSSVGRAHPLDATMAGERLAPNRSVVEPETAVSGAAPRPDATRPTLKNSSKIKRPASIAVSIHSKVTSIRNRISLKHSVN